MDLGKTPRDNDLLTICVIGFIRTSKQSFTSHVKGSNVSIMDMQDSSTNRLTCDKVLDWNPLCMFNIFLQKKLLKQWAICYVILYSQH